MTTTKRRAKATLRHHRQMVVAVFNSNDDIVEMLRLLIEHAGFVTVSGHIDDVRRGNLDFMSFMRQHDPFLVIYDLVPPYDRSWAFLSSLMESPAMRGRLVILTSVNAKRAREVVGADKTVYEILGKPLDLDAIVRAVKEASRNRSEIRAGTRARRAG
jgi:DNA-binding NarL/FixJ family response regulator